MTKRTPSVILNVDDNSANLYAKSRVLRHAGFTVIEAQTGGEALRLAGTLQPDLVLLDVHLPDMSGYDVCRQIKNGPVTSKLFVLHISASYVDVRDKTRGLEGGADGYLTEPVEPEELVATVRAFLRLRQTESALRESEERLRVALEAGKMATWDWDIRHNRLVCSEGLETMLGLAHGALDGTIGAYMALVYPEDRDRVEAAMQQAIQQQSEYQLEFRMVHAQGSTIWVEARGRAYYDATGQPMRMAGIHQDISERKQAAEMLRTLNMTLEQRVRQRTAQLERSNRELDQFAYIASHDLKAPLRGIDLLANWITQDAADLLPEPSRAHLTKMRGRVQRMDRLLDDLLAFSRVGRYDGAAEPVKTEDLIHNVVALLGPPAGFAVHMVGELPEVVTPRAPLEIVFRNLIDNAIKHHDQPHCGKVYIQTQRLGDKIEFCISDNGPGIDPQHHERIFGIFQTLQPRDQVEGSGMGLAIVKKTVEYRGGEVRVESEVGKGTTICFTWPQQSTKEEQPLEGASPE